MSEQYTQEEMNKMFILECLSLVDTWANVDDRTTKGKLKGLLHSVLAMLDGEGVSMPAFMLIPYPHPDDKTFRQSMNEDYWPPFPEELNTREDIVALNGGRYLHDMLNARYKEDD